MNNRNLLLFNYAITNRYDIITLIDSIFMFLRKELGIDFSIGARNELKFILIALPVNSESSIRIVKLSSLRSQPWGLFALSPGCVENE